jgi:hypothetical protein
MTDGDLVLRTSWFSWQTPAALTALPAIPFSIALGWLALSDPSSQSIMALLVLDAASLFAAALIETLCFFVVVRELRLSSNRLQILRGFRRTAVRWSQLLPPNVGIWSSRFYPLTPGSALVIGYRATASDSPGRAIALSKKQARAVLRHPSFPFPDVPQDILRSVDPEN